MKKPILKTAGAAIMTVYVGLIVLTVLHLIEKYL